MSSISVKLFGNLSELAGVDNLTFESISDLSSLRIRINENHPPLSSSKFAIAVNNKIITENCILKENDSIALLPPFSGG